MNPGAKIVPSPEPWFIFRASPSRRLDEQYFSHVRRGDRYRGRVRINDAKKKLVAFTYRRQVEKDTGAGLVGAKRRARRIVRCVNACYGISNQTLKDADWILKFATELMRTACDFGDLHLQTLPDRISKNMREIYGEWLKQPSLPQENDDDELDPEIDQPLSREGPAG